MKKVVAIKAQFVRKDTTEVRRFSGDYDWDGIKTVVAHLWGGNSPKSCGIEYIDDDGDNVRIGSEMEWQECLRLFSVSSSPVLRLTVKRVKKDDKHLARTAAVVVEVASPAAPDVEEEEDVSAVETITKPSIPVLNTTALVAESPLESQSETASEEEAEPVFNLLSILYQCDAKLELLNPLSTQKFGRVATITVIGDELDVDLNQEELRAYSLTVANNSFDRFDFERAEQILAAAAVVFPTNKVIRYNLACAQSLLNRREAAIASLAEAIRVGYNNVQNLVNDDDLQNIRNMPEFSNLVNPLLASATTATEDNDVVVIEAADIVPVAQPTLQYPSEVEVMRSIFPDLDPAVADELIKSTKGNVRAAINSMLQ